MPSLSYQEFRDLLKRKAYREASSFAERQSLLYGDKNEFWLTQQAVALNCARQYERAIKIAEKALKSAPNNGYALLAKTDAILGTGRVKEALAYYEELTNFKDKNIISRSRRGLLSCLVRFKDWLRILSLLAEWNMPASNAMPWRIKAFIGLGREDEALDACREWLRLSPDHPDALWKLTELEVAREGLEPVLKRLGRLAKIPSRPPIYREIYASLCKRSGKMEEAIEQYTKLSASCVDFRIQRKRAFALAKAGEEETAIPMMEELLRLDPKDFYLHSSFTAACRRVGDLERAWKFYNKLIALHPDIKAIHGRLRRIEKKLESSSPVGGVGRL